MEKVDNSSKKRCFVIMPISDPENYEPGHFKKVYEQLFKPAIEQAGYEPFRADEDKSSNSIHIRILQQLLEAPMALCDLSAKNPNVLYELGIRQAFEKPVVLVNQIGTEKIFDISSINTIDYRPKRIYDEVLEDQRIIAEAITATAHDTKNLSSITKLIGIESAQLPTGNISDSDSKDLMLRSILNEVRVLKSQVNRIDFTEQDTQNNLNRKEIDAIGDFLIQSTISLEGEIIKQLALKDKLSEDTYREYLSKINSLINEIKKCNILYDSVKSALISRLSILYSKIAIQLQSEKGGNTNGT